MEQQGPLAASRIVESLTGWWELAGVDGAVGDDAVNWLALDAKPDPIVAPSLNTTPTQNLPAEVKTEWPGGIEALRGMIADGESLPGNSFGNKSVASIGPAKASVMVISDLPDADELSSCILGSGSSGKLLEKMLAAINIQLGDCHWTTLSSTIPAAGELPDANLPDLAAFARHQIDLVEPQRLILLGSATCRALLGIELMDARGNLQNINHDEGKLTVLTTFHPRTLIARPQMKAQAWKDLQMFAKRNVL